MQHVFTRLARAKGAFALVVVALGISLGAAVCATALTWLILRQPLPYPEQERLIVAEQVVVDPGDAVFSRDFSYPALAFLQGLSRQVLSPSVMIDRARDLILSHPAQPLISVTYASEGYAQLFAPPMALGVFPSQAQTIGTERPVAVISHAAWQTLFGQRDDVLNLRIRTASGVDFKIVGVTSPSFVEPAFGGPGQRTAVWLPWAFNPSAATWGWSASTDTLSLAGRLRPDINIAQAADQLSILLDSKWSEETGVASSAATSRSTRVELRAASKVIAGDGRLTAPLLLVATFGLMLITLVNITHYLAAWVTQRRREFSIRLALGGRRRHLFRLLLSEMLALMLPASVVALLFAAAGFWLMQRYLGNMLPRLQELTMDGWTLLATLAAAVALAFALSAACLLSAGALASSRELTAGRRSTASKPSTRLRAALMAGQIAVACLLIAVSVGLFRDASRVLGEDAVRLDRSSSVYLYLRPTDQPSQASSLSRRLLAAGRHFAELPGVEAVSQSHSPLQDFIKTRVTLGQSGAQYPVELKRIDHRYLDITGHTLAAGRNFSADDIQRGAGVAMVNTSFARTLQRDGQVLGMRLYRSPESAITVVGVIEDLSSAVSPSTRPQVFFPASEAGSNFIIRWRAGQRMSREQLVESVAIADPMLGVFLYDDLEQQRDDLQLPQVLTALSTLAIATLVMLVSALGLFGMVRYATHLARGEIGARLAFGARPRDILRLVLSSHLAALAAGYVLTVVVAFLLLPLLGVQLLTVRPLDASLAMIALAALGLAACYLSARPLLSRPPAVLLENGDR